MIRCPMGMNTISSSSLANSSTERTSSRSSIPDKNQFINEWIFACRRTQTPLIDDQNDENNVQDVCIRYDFKKDKPSHNFLSSTVLQQVNTYDNPLSPDSQKKELCRYLKLMKPADQKEIILLKNRRSVRVKILEQKLKDDSDKLTIKKDLNFPLPPPDVYENVKDFDEDIKMVIGQKEKKLKTKYNSNDFVKLLQNRVKAAEKKKNLIYDWKRVNSLRSRGKLKHITIDWFTHNTRRRNLRRNNKTIDTKVNNKNSSKINKLKKTNKNISKAKEKTNKLIVEVVNYPSRLKTSVVSDESLEIRSKFVEETKPSTNKKPESLSPKTPEKTSPRTSSSLKMGRSTPRFLNSTLDLDQPIAVSNDESIDLKSFIDDMLEFDKLSDEHKKSLIEIYSIKPMTNILNQKSSQINDNKLKEAQKIYRRIQSFSPIKKSKINDEKTEEVNETIWYKFEKLSETKPQKPDNNEQVSVPSEVVPDDKNVPSKEDNKEEEENNPEKEKQFWINKVQLRDAFRKRRRRKSKRNLVKDFKTKWPMLFKRIKKINRKRTSVVGVEKTNKKAVRNKGNTEKIVNKTETNDENLKIPEIKTVVDDKNNVKGSLQEKENKNDQKSPERNSKLNKPNTENKVTKTEDLLEAMNEITPLIVRKRGRPKGSTNKKDPKVLFSIGAQFASKPLVELKEKQNKLSSNNNQSLKCDENQKNSTLYNLLTNGQNKKIDLKIPPIELSPKKHVLQDDNISGTLKKSEINTNIIFLEHDYAHNSGCEEDEEEESDEESESDSDYTTNLDEVELCSSVSNNNISILPFNDEIKATSLHKNLSNSKKKITPFINLAYQGNQKKSHSIIINEENGIIMKAFYLDYHLIIVQEYEVSFWTQSALGNILGAQCMWIPNGNTQRLVLNQKYIQKDSMDMIISMDNSVAYVELWTNEHKSDFREIPMADVFASVYFSRHRQIGLEKKLLQLENIKGYSDDVHFVVLRSCPKIIVSWYFRSINSKITNVHCYQLAADYQTVANITEMQSVEHYVSSLHNIEDCDNLVFGSGDNKLTLWNTDYGYIVATINLLNFGSPIKSFWAKCDRGFLFTVQESDNQELSLLAINGINHSWKKLQTYNPSPGFNRLKSLSVENGILIAFYNEGIICWNAQTGEPVVEETSNETEYLPSGKYIIIIDNEQIIVKHILNHLITTEDV